MSSPRTVFAWLWTLLILGACWTPKRMMPDEGDDPSVPFLVPNFDKGVHFALFFGFAYLWMRSGSVKLCWVIAGGFAVTVISELGQLVPIVNRDANLADATADMLGVGAGVLAFGLAQILFRTRPVAGGSIKQSHS